MPPTWDTQLGLVGGYNKLQEHAHTDLVVPSLVLAGDHMMGGLKGVVA